MDFILWEVSDIAYEIKRLEHFKPDKIFAGLNICQSKYMPIEKFAYQKIRQNPFIHPPPNILVLICTFYNIKIRLYLSIPPNIENEESKVI